MRGNNRSNRRRRDRFGNRMAIIGITVVVASLAFVVNVKTSSLESKYQEYQIREETLQKLKAAEESRAEQLEEHRIYVDTKQYIEEVAKEKLGLVKPDEILLKPDEKK